MGESGGQSLLDFSSSTDTTQSKVDSFTKRCTAKANKEKYSSAGKLDQPSLSLAIQADCSKTQIQAQVHPNQEVARISPHILLHALIFKPKRETFTILAAACGSVCFPGSNQGTEFYIC